MLKEAQFFGHHIIRYVSYLKDGFFSYSIFFFIENDKMKHVRIKRYAYFNLKKV